MAPRLLNFAGRCRLRESCLERSTLDTAFADACLADDRIHLALCISDTDRAALGLLMEFYPSCNVDRISHGIGG